MPLSKINRPGLNTGVTDNSDATAITIDSSERVGLGTSSPNFRQQIVYGTSGGLAVTSNAIGADDTTALTANAKSNTSSDYAFKAGSYNDGFRLLVRADGMVTMPKQPSFLARGLAGQPAVGAAFVFNGTDYNRGNCYSTSKGRFTAPVDGFYMFTCHVMGDSTNNRLMLRLFKNGTHMSQGSSSSNGSQYQDSRIAFMMYMAAGDYAEVINQGNKNRYDNGPTHNHFAGHLLG